ncbi:MAG: hypothetical protein IJ094_02485 [Bacilli bacterium]|nr:hypothetical protein [Bacilli bacterium]
MNYKFDSFYIEETKKTKFASLIVFIVFIIIIFFVLWWIFSDIYKEKKLKLDTYENIKHYVKENYKELNEIVIKYKENKSFDLPAEIKYMSSCYYDDNKIGVEFITFSRGRDFAIGFIYSENDIPFRINCETNDIVNIDKKSWKWVDKTKNIEEFQKIKKNWYYWYMSF